MTDLLATLAVRLVDAWVAVIAWCWDRIDASFDRVLAYMEPWT